MSEKGNRDNDMELLSAYLDNELGEAERNKVAAFLGNSQQARTALEGLRHTKLLLTATPPTKAPVDLLDALEAQAEAFVAKRHAQEAASRKWFSPWAWAGAAACAALAVGIGFWPSRQIPVESLLTAHAASQTSLGLHQNLISAAHSPATTNELGKI